MPPSLDLSLLNLDREVSALLPQALAHKIEGICIGQPEPGLLTVVVPDPTEVSLYELIDMATQHRFKAQLLGGAREQIRLAQEYVYEVSAARQHETWKQWLESKRFAGASLDLTRKDSNAAGEVTGQVVDMADAIIKEAISVGASDIHLETYDDGLLVRYRQDGVLRVINQLSPELGGPVVKRLKVMANMDITQDRMTQGGRIGLQIGGRGYDLRVSAVPVAEGESLVLRVLSKGAFSTTLNDLGFSEDQFRQYSRFIGHPHGLILTCGPTGAGKSTTLYASLKSIQRPDRKLLTVEDPVEYQMPGIIQVQVNRAPKEVERQVTFASTLREFLRHDPDVILVGEIRDEETAHISIQAALTGHLVLSTIHTNDAVGIVNRLKDQGVKPYLIASTLIGGVAQRLVRRVCADCAQVHPMSAEEKDLFGKYGLEAEQLARGKGCERCLNSGMRGRVGLYEVLSITDEIRELIERGATALEIQRTALSQGMKPLAHSGLVKAAQGQVALEEVRRVCQV